jgi:hypothetical protein
MVASIQDPAVQGYMASSGAYAQKQMEKQKAAMAAAPALTAASMAAGMFASMIPVGGNLIGGAAGAAMGMAQQQMLAAQAPQALAEGLAQTQGMMSIMPQMMRAQHVMQLAQAKNCAFMKGVTVTGAPGDTNLDTVGIPPEANALEDQSTGMLSKASLAASNATLATGFAVTPSAMAPLAPNVSMTNSVAGNGASAITSINGGALAVGIANGLQNTMGH